MRRHQLIRKAAALAMAAALLGLVALAAISYSGGLSNRATLTVLAPRAGLSMDPGARVKFRDVQIGTVQSIDMLSDRLARITLRVDPTDLPSIPANASVAVTSTTVFGAKYVDFEEPRTAAEGRLQPGAQIRTGNVTVELNTVFQQLTNVLDTVEPQKLNATLGSLATTLRSRGDRLGDALVKADDTLTKVNSASGALNHDLAALAPVTQMYGAIAPDLMKTLDHTSNVSQTIVSESKNLDTLLLNATGFANSGNDLLAHSSAPLTTALQVLRPTTSLLDEYSPEIPCLFKGLDNSNRIGSNAYKAQPGVKMSFGLLGGVQPYQYPQDMPKVHATGGPHCMGLPHPDPNVNAHYLVTDTGVNPFESWRQGPRLKIAGLVDYLFGVDMGSGK